MGIIEASHRLGPSQTQTTERDGRGWVVTYRQQSTGRVRKCSFQSCPGRERLSSLIDLDSTPLLLLWVETWRRHSISWSPRPRWPLLRRETLHRHLSRTRWWTAILRMPSGGGLASPEGASHLAGGPFADRILGQVEVHRWEGIPGLVAALGVVAARRSVAVVGAPGVIWGRLALTQAQDRPSQDRLSQDRRG